MQRREFLVAGLGLLGCGSLFAKKEHKRRIIYELQPLGIDGYKSIVDKLYTSAKLENYKKGIVCGAVIGYNFNKTNLILHSFPDCNDNIWMVSKCDIPTWANIDTLEKRVIDKFKEKGLHVHYGNRLGQFLFS